MWFISTPDCIMCALESRFSELRSFSKDVNAYVRLGTKVMELTRNGRAAMFIESFNYLRGYLGINDIHEREKQDLERVGKELIDRLREILGTNIIDYFNAAAAANSVDIKMRGYEFNIDDLKNKILEKPVWLGIDDNELNKIISSITTVGYLVDNAGEFQVDLLLIEKLIEKGLKINVYARAEPYEVDVTYDYIKDILNMPGIIVKKLPGNYSAFWYKELVNDLNYNELIISKGLDNLETYAETKPNIKSKVIFLLRAKCPIIANLLNVPWNSPVIMSTKLIDKLTPQ